MHTFTPNTTIESSKVNANFSGLADGTEVNNGAITPAKRTGGFKIGSFTSNGSTGNQAITGVGFTPKLVRFIWLVGNATSAHFSGQGAMDASGNQYATATGGNLSNLFRYSSTSACLAGFTSVADATPELVATFVSMDADGFTFNITTATALSFAYEAYA